MAVLVLRQDLFRMLRLRSALLWLGCCTAYWLVTLAPAGHAAPSGKLAPERKDKDEWRQAMNNWQANENQEFMQEYEENQRERERIRQRNAPKFDPTNPKEYVQHHAVPPSRTLSAAHRPTPVRRTGT